MNWSADTLSAATKNPLPLGMGSVKAINQGEWDMVIMDDEKMDIYEIKRSDTCNENQSKWLTDMEMKQEGERLFGKPIRKRVVLYRGQNSIVTRKGYEIEYRNIDSFLINLVNSLYLT